VSLLLFSIEGYLMGHQKMFRKHFTL